MSLAAQLVHSCRGGANALAVLERGERHSFGELDQASARVAGVLAAEGVYPGDVVAVRAARSWWRCMAILGCWRAGAAVLSLDPAEPAAHAGRIVHDTRPKMMLTAPGTAPAALGIAEIEISQAYSRAPSLETRPGPLAYVIATSGTTGTPKYVAMPPAAMERLADWHRRHWPHAEPPRTAHLSPVGFDVGYQELAATWAAAAPLIVVDERTRQDPFDLLNVMHRSEVRRAFLIASALQALVIAAATTGTALPSSLRQIFVSGERLVVTGEVRATFAAAGTTLINQYGPSETHAVTEYWLPDDPARWPVHPPIGTALPWADLLSHADGTARPFRVGEESELLIAGKTVAVGYLGAADLTAARFQEVRCGDGTSRRCYFSGDRVRFDGHMFHFVGRLDEQLKIRGYRVEPAQVEEVLNSAPGVAQAAVVGVPGPDSVQLVAAIVPVPGAAVAAAELRAVCRASLPEYMVPARFVITDALPASTNGKVMRSKLVQSIAGHVRSGRSSTSPSSLAPGRGADEQP